MAASNSNLYFRSLEELSSGVACSSGEVCTFTVPTCNSCAKAVCRKDATVAPESKSDKKPNTGAIAGGVVGGVIAIAVVTYLVWRFCIKPRRQHQIAQESYEDEPDHRVEAEKEFGARRDKRSSVHTVHSIASTVLTRASNIIQIAYIPGVTNRATPTSPTLLVPPVPPIPMHASSLASNSPSYEDQHFFVPGDLRDSTYSGLSGDSDRMSYARTSYAPRSSIAPSIASTIYGKNAVVVAPAQTGMRAKAAMVSVKSMGGSAGGEVTPPVPSIDYDKFDAAKPRDSTFSVGSTFLNNASTTTATQGRAQVIRLGSGNQVKQVSVGSRTDDESSVTAGRTASSSTSIRDSNAVTVIDESPSVDQGPFSDPPSIATRQSTTSLSAVIEEATKRAAQGPDRKSKRQSVQERHERGTSPFGDEHATRD
ncbi:conserved hypothetical protein [Verticillium alfalfae VaMs.102]|uniref:Membrane anchor Opy2 N-terminal domain-containing protein n=1 Tax=Verticillium alfalfae (strain VaMs.102 / ATCC MYA-4576 / FGSC 10136) TaxID=526221 RepID=C9S598_VERA1|nr:conserved hypothetical protein [Verticillium alfalfae VaMs.102]EEY14198.1 conserved hypothetical protein [Verticillium alfalfae VaMs.102]